MNIAPLISVVIPCYNAAPFISETISGFLNQTYLNIEIIVQDDCSTDGTWEQLVQLYSHHPTIHLFQNSNNMGIGANWNEAYDKASGDFIVVFNADDIVDKCFLTEHMHYFSLFPDVDFIISPFYRTDDTEKSSELREHFQKRKGKTRNLINYNIDKYFRIHWNYTLGKKNSFDRLKNQYGLFYPTQVCDSMLWYEAFKQNLKAYYTGEPMGMYRMHENNNSKIPLGEFESTLLWMLPIYPTIYKMKAQNTKYSLLIKYLYACLKHKRTPKVKALYNIIQFH